MVKSRQLVQEYRQQIGKFTYEQMDCIKSIENIITRHGGKSALTGSNWWVRHEIINLRPLTDKAQLYDGCAVLKTKHPGESGYALPDRYKGDANQIDYNHIGLGTDAGEILDSTRYTDSAGNYIRNGPDVSTAPIGPDSWDIIGDFEDVDYSDMVGNPTYEPAKLTNRAAVVAPKGDTVNLRSRPSSKAIVLAYVKVGTLVERNENDGEWSRIITPEGKSGWMKSEYLSTPPPASAGSDLQSKLDTAIALLQEIASAMRTAG